jgi:hypothetical protein
VAPTVRQTNFSAGELGPLYWGRTDLEVFARGLRRCRNFFITKSGAAMSRPGTTLVAEVSGGAVRLAPFVASDSEAYVVQFSTLGVKVYFLGALVWQHLGVVDGLNAALPAAVLPRLKWAQIGDVLTICRPGENGVWAPWELRRITRTQWTLTNASFTPPSSVSLDTPDPAGVTFDAFDENNPLAAIIPTTPWMLKKPLPVADASHPEQEWIWGFTAILQRLSDGAQVESVLHIVKVSGTGAPDLPNPDPLGRSFLVDNQIALYPDKPVTLARFPIAGTANNEYRVLFFRIYRGKGKAFGYIGETTTREFLDDGREPNYALQPPLGENPFAVRPNTNGVVYRTPVSVGFFQWRRVFGGALGGTYGVGGTETLQPQPGFVYASAAGQYQNYDERHRLDVSGEALVFELGARRMERIRHLVALERLVVLTDSSVWTIGGQAGSPLDFDSLDMRANDDVGATDVVPVVVDGAVLFVRTKGSGARALVPQAADTPYQGVNISELASHLFVGPGRAVVDWCYQEDPWGLVWAVREDGTLLSLTFDRQRDMAAWARHDTDGVVESICSVPEGEEDAVYVVVRRTVPGGLYAGERRFMERFTSRVRRALETSTPPEVVATPTPTDTNSLYPTDLCLDSAITYKGVPKFPFFNDPLLLPLVGRQVYVVARGCPVLGPFTVEQEDTGGGPYGVFDMTGHLSEAPATNAVDQNGDPIWVAHVGLAYTCELETLDVAGGDARLRKKTITQVGFEVDSSRGLSVGQDLEHLKPWRQRKVRDSYDPISAATELVTTPVSAAWDQSARAALRQTLPLPVTVVGITRELALDNPDGLG